MAIESRQHLSLLMFACLGSSLHNLIIVLMFLCKKITTKYRELALIPQDSYNIRIEDSEVDDSSV